MSSADRLRKTVLTPDDTEESLEQTGYILKKGGYEVVPSRSGEEALELFTALNITRTEDEVRNKIDAVVTDFNMGRMDGLELVENIRKLAPEVPAVIITGNIEQVRQTARDRKVILPPILGKPVDREELLSAMDEILSPEFAVQSGTALEVEQDMILKRRMGNDQEDIGSRCKNFEVEEIDERGAWLRELNDFGGSVHIDKRHLTEKYFRIGKAIKEEND